MGATSINRIKALDGLRAIAALGVVWIHIWNFYGAPAWNWGQFNFYQSIAILGNGVDFFFVISGFCMYLVAGQMKLSTFGYTRFMLRRFLRIAPAFYTAVIAYALLQFYINNFFPGRDVLYHFLFLNNITGNNISGPFWSIGTEWHFYLVLPLLLWISWRFTLTGSVLLCSLISLIFFALVNLGFFSYDFWESQVLVRFPEFGVGIIAGFWYTRQKQIHPGLRGVMGVSIFIIIMFIGRLMKFTPVLTMLGGAGFLSKTLADLVMTTGFGLLAYHSVTVVSPLSRFLSLHFINYLGKISFSIYLWHSMVIFFLTPYLLELPATNWRPLLAFMLVILPVIGLSHLSYHLLEASYFKWRRASYMHKADVSRSVI